MGKPWTLDHGSSSHLGVFIFSSSLSPDPYLFPALPLYTSSCYTSKNCWARLASLQVSGLLVGKPLVSVWMKVCGFFSSLWIHWRFMINLRFFTFIPEAEDWQVTECLGLTVAQNPSQLSSKVSSFKDQLSPAKDWLSGAGCTLSSRYIRLSAKDLQPWPHIIGWSWRRDDFLNSQDLLVRNLGCVISRAWFLSPDDNQVCIAERRRRVSLGARPSCGVLTLCWVRLWENKVFT